MPVIVEISSALLISSPSALMTPTAEVFEPPVLDIATSTFAVPLRVKAMALPQAFATSTDVTPLSSFQRMVTLPMTLKNGASAIAPSAIGSLS